MRVALSRAIGVLCQSRCCSAIVAEIAAMMAGAAVVAFAACAFLASEPLP